jgi:hypothetical protein
MPVSDTYASHLARADLCVGVNGLARIGGSLAKAKRARALFFPETQVFSSFDLVHIKERNALQELGRSQVVAPIYEKVGARAMLTLMRHFSRAKSSLA